MQNKDPPIQTKYLPERSSYRLFSKLRNSSRVFALDLMAPSMQLVVVDEAVF
jgi:hypothetical protein